MRKKWKSCSKRTKSPTSTEVPNPKPIKRSPFQGPYVSLHIPFQDSPHTLLPLPASPTLIFSTAGSWQREPTNSEFSITGPYNLFWQIPDRRDKRLLALYVKSQSVTMPRFYLGSQALKPSRMLKKSASFVLAALGGSTYQQSTPRLLACCGRAGRPF